MTDLLSTRSLLDDVEQLYETLKRNASRQTKKDNLDTLWAVLAQMRLANASDYSIAEVGRRLEKVDGLKTQSLRNEGGKDFREIIAAFARAVGGSEERLPRRERSPLDIALDAVADPGIRTLFKQVVAENRMLKHQNDELRSAFKSLSVSAAAERPVVQTAGMEAIPQRSTAGDLTPSEIEALRRSIDPDRLAENGWDIQPNGSIREDTGMTVLPPGFAFAVAKIVNSR
jgi:hypothetical protein